MAAMPTPVAIATIIVKITIKEPGEPWTSTVKSWVASSPPFVPSNDIVAGRSPSDC